MMLFIYFLAFGAFAQQAGYTPCERAQHAGKGVHAHLGSRSLFLHQRDMIALGQVNQQQVDAGRAPAVPPVVSPPYDASRASAYAYRLMDDWIEESHAIEQSSQEYARMLELRMEAERLEAEEEAERAAAREEALQNALAAQAARARAAESAEAETAANFRQYVEEVPRMADNAEGEE